MSEKRLKSACGPEDTSWQVDSCRTVYNATGFEWLGDVARLNWLTETLPPIILIFAIAWLVNLVARRLVVNSVRAVGGGLFSRGVRAIRNMTPDSMLDTKEVSLRAEKRREAILGIVKSVISVVVYLIAFLVVLGRLGVDLGSVLTATGLVGVALGFGAQGLIKDFIAGVFILIEDQYGIGDEVVFGAQAGQSGTVEALSLRSTRVRSVNGTVWHVPNGSMVMVGNQSQHWSRAVLDVAVAYNVDLALAKQVIGKVAADVREADAAVLGQPEVWGVQDLGPEGITIRVVIKTMPSAQWRVLRNMREQIKSAFDEAGIVMAGAQLMAPQDGDSSQ